VAMSLACKQVVSIQALVMQIAKMLRKTRIHEDNRASIKLALTEKSQTLRHLVQLSYHYVRHLSSEAKIKIYWISTKEQLGNFFTKPLAKPDFCKFHDMLMCDFSSLQKHTEKRNFKQLANTAECDANEKEKRPQCCRKEKLSTATEKCNAKRINLLRN